MDGRTFEMRSVCPSCDEDDVLRLCSGRVLALLGAQALLPMTCPVCATTAPAAEFWHDVHATSALDAADASTCRPGRQCIGC